MNKSQHMLINAICLYTAPEVMRFSALFSGLTEVLEKAMSGFAGAVSGQPAELDIHSHFSDELDGLAGDVVEQLQQQSAEILREYGALLETLEYDGKLQAALDCIEHFSATIPALIPLDQPCQARDLLAYLSFMDKEDIHSKALLGFLDSFQAVFAAMEEERRRQAEEEKANEQAWFVAAVNNDVAQLDSLLSSGIDIELEDSGGRRTALARAVENNGLAAAEFLLAHNAKPVAFFSSDSPIVIAIEQNHATIVEAIIGAKHESLQDFDWHSALQSHVADDYIDTFRPILAAHADKIKLYKLAESVIQGGADRLLELFFSHGLDVNDRESSTPLIFVALKEKRLKAMQVLIAHGADLNATDWHGHTLLQDAIDESVPEMIDLLLEHGAKLNFDNHYYNNLYIRKLARQTGRSLEKCLQYKLFDYQSLIHNGQNFLHYLASLDPDDDEDSQSTGTIDMIRVLLDDFKLDINQLTENNENTALTLARSEPVFDYLLARSPDLTVCFDRDQNIIEKMGSCFEGRSIVKLLEAGADPDSIYCRLPLLHYAIRENEDYIGTVMDCGADVNNIDSNKKTVIQRWIADKELLGPHLRKLAEHGADFSLHTWTGLPVFHALCAFYDVALVKEIVNIADIDIHVCDLNGNNAVMQATFARNLPILVYLAESGVDVNKANKTGGMPLLHAVYANDVELVDCLVTRCGAETRIELAGKNLQYLAMQLANYDVLEYLRQHDALQITE